MDKTANHEHEQIQETLNSIAESNEHIETIKNVENTFQIEVDGNANSVESVAHEIEASEVADSTYTIDSSLKDKGIIRVVSPEHRQVERQIKDDLNEYVAEYL